MFKRLTNAIFLPTGSPNRDSETGTQFRGAETDNLTEIDIYCFSDDEAIGFADTNVRSAMNDLDILFSAGVYTRLGDHSVPLPKQQEEQQLSLLDREMETIDQVEGVVAIDIG